MACWHACVRVCVCVCDCFDVGIFFVCGGGWGGEGWFLVQISNIISRALFCESGGGANSTYAVDKKKAISALSDQIMEREAYMYVFGAG